MKVTRVISTKIELNDVDRYKLEEEVDELQRYIKPLKSEKGKKALPTIMKLLDELLNVEKIFQDI